MRCSRSSSSAQCCSLDVSAGSRTQRGWRLTEENSCDGDDVGSRHGRNERGASRRAGCNRVVKRVSGLRGRALVEEADMAPWRERQRKGPSQNKTATSSHSSACPSWTLSQTHASVLHGSAKIVHRRSEHAGTQARDGVAVGHALGVRPFSPSQRVRMWMAGATHHCARSSRMSA